MNTGIDTVKEFAMNTFDVSLSQAWDSNNGDATNLFFTGRYGVRELIDIEEVNIVNKQCRLLYGDNFSELRIEHFPSIQSIRSDYQDAANYWQNANSSKSELLWRVTGSPKMVQQLLPLFGDVL